MKPLVLTDKTPKDIVGDNGFLLQDVYLGKISSKSDKQFAGEIFKELRRNGFYPNIHIKDHLEFIQIMTADDREQIDLNPDSRTPKNIGRIRFKIVRLLLDGRISREDAEYIQGLPDDKVIKAYEAFMQTLKEAAA